MIIVKLYLSHQLKDRRVHEKIYIRYDVFGDILFGWYGYSNRKG